MSRKPSDPNAATASRFASLIAARTPLREHAVDWEEGYSKATDMTHTIGGTTGDSRVVGEAIAGMKDHVENKVTGQLEETTIPEREGHGLADRCTALADAIDEWIRAGNGLAAEALRLMPADHSVAMMIAKHRDVHLAGAGICQRCKRDVPGIVESPLLGVAADRLKSGFCFGQEPHCYAAWERSGKLNRARFIADWPKESGTHETPGTSTTNANAVPSSVSSSDVHPNAGAA